MVLFRWQKKRDPSSTTEAHVQTPNTWNYGMRHFCLFENNNLFECKHWILNNSFKVWGGDRNVPDYDNDLMSHSNSKRLLTSSTFPDVLSFQQKWIRESSDCWTYTEPLRLSGVTTFPFRVIFPARNSTRYLLVLPLEPLTRLGKRAPDDILRLRC